MKNEVFRQRGYILITGFLALAVFAAVLGFSTAESLVDFAIIFLIEIVLILIVVLFNSFTVEVGEQGLIWYFGLHFLEKELSFSHIRNLKITRNPIYWAFGIKVFSGGVSYNVSGTKVLEITTVNGRKIRLGCNNPESLKKSITKNRSAQT